MSPPRSSRASASARRSGRTSTTAGWSSPHSGLIHPGRYFAGLAAAADRAGADLHEGVRATAIRRQADGRFVVETERGAILARDVFVATNGYTDGVVPTLRRRVIPIGSYIIASEPLPEDLARELSPKGRSFYDTKNFLYYWHLSSDRRMVFGGRASFMPTSIDRTAAILHKGLLEVHPQLAGYRIEYAWGGNVGFTFDRMPHVGPNQGRRHVCARVLRHGRRADDAPGHGRRGLAGGRRGAGADEDSSSRWCRPRTRAVRGSFRSLASGSGSRTGSPLAPAQPPSLTDKVTSMPKPLAVQLYTFRDTTRPGPAGLGLDLETLEVIAEMGYLGVETVDVPGGDPVAARQALADVGLQVASSHSWGDPGDLEAFEQASAAVAALGSTRIIVSGGPFPTRRRCRGLRRPDERRGRPSPDGTA